MPNFELHKIYTFDTHSVFSAYKIVVHWDILNVPVAPCDIGYHNIHLVMIKTNHCQLASEAHNLLITWSDDPDTGVVMKNGRLCRSVVQ